MSYEEGMKYREANEGGSMQEQLRRSVPRQTTDWFGRFRFDDTEDEPWRGCRVLDLSPLGAGLEIFETVPGEYMDGRLTVSLELHGDPRNVVFDVENKTARVGMQFPAPTGAAKEYVRSLSDIRSRW